MKRILIPVDIVFRTSKLRKIGNSLKDAKRTYGQVGGQRLIDRLNEIRDADNLAVLMTLPQARCHPMTGDRQGQFSVDLDHPHRLLFEPAHEPVPTQADGGVDLPKVTAVKILGVEDTHG